MALLPPDYMKTVVAIGTKTENNSMRWTSTGFLYIVPLDDDPSRGSVFLVTNRHIVKPPSSPASLDLYVRMNREGNLGAMDLALNPANWYFHQTADVAVVGINMEVVRANELSYKWFNETLTPEKATEIGVSEGDGVFVLGFPQGNIGTENRNFVIVRQGCIARVQDWLSGERRNILIDAPVYPGNSGGPVVLKPEAIAIQNTKNNSRAYLIGMVESYIPYQDTAISPQTGRPRVVFEENTGLANVIPGDVIEETVKLALDGQNTNAP